MRVIVMSSPGSRLDRWVARHIGAAILLPRSQVNPLTLAMRHVAAFVAPGVEKARDSSTSSGGRNRTRTCDLTDVNRAL